MYNYKIGYYTPDEDYYEILTCEKKFTKNEITQMILEGLEYLIQKNIDETEKDETTYYFQDFFNKQNNNFNIINYLIEFKGFKKLSYTLWDCDGFMDLVREDDYQRQDKKCKEIQNVLSDKFKEVGEYLNKLEEIEAKSLDNQREIDYLKDTFFSKGELN